jgi:Tol biopolymer transport system component
MKTIRFFAVLLSAAVIAPASDDALAKWRQGVSVHPASKHPGRHSMHTYFTVSPESPDGNWVLFYSSTTPEGERGEIVIANRRTGQERIIARNIATEDAHRVACQQWISNGKRVVFHKFEGTEPVVMVVDLDTGKQRTLARGRLVGFGQPKSDLIPIYPPHWKNAAARKDLELLNVATGKIETIVTAEATLKAYPDRIKKIFGEKPITLFFPDLSPDLKRVYFKLSTPISEEFRSKEASFREMLVVYDMEKSKFLFIRDRWGHPNWNQNSRDILNVPNVIDNSETGQAHPIPGIPVLPGQHLSFSFDGKLFASDTKLAIDAPGNTGNWRVVAADVNGNKLVVLHEFDNSKGAKTWRVSHPHPAFSPDSKRIYFNVSSTEWTQLYVAESADSAGGSTGELSKK